MSPRQRPKSRARSSGEDHRIEFRFLCHSAHLPQLNTAAAIKPEFTAIPSTECRFCGKDPLRGNRPATHVSRSKPSAEQPGSAPGRKVPETIPITLPNNYRNLTGTKFFARAKSGAAKERKKKRSCRASRRVLQFPPPGRIATDLPQYFMAVGRISGDSRQRPITARKPDQTLIARKVLRILTLTRDPYRSLFLLINPSFFTAADLKIVLRRDRERKIYVGSLYNRTRTIMQAPIKILFFNTKFTWHAICFYWGEVH